MYKRSGLLGWYSDNGSSARFQWVWSGVCLSQSMSAGILNALCCARCVVNCYILHSFQRSAIKDVVMRFNFYACGGRGNIDTCLFSRGRWSLVRCFEKYRWQDKLAARFVFDFIRFNSNFVLPIAYMGFSYHFLISGCNTLCSW